MYRDHTFSATSGSHRHHRRRSGWTLIEMAIVLAIILILVGIAIYSMRDVDDPTKVKEAEVFVRTMARFGALADFETDQACEWSPSSRVGKTVREWDGLLIGDYKLRPDGKVRCSYCMEVTGSGSEVYAMAACDVNADGTIRVYIIPVLSGGVPTPGTTDPIAGLLGTTRDGSRIAGADPVTILPSLEGSEVIRHAVTPTMMPSDY